MSKLDLPTPETIGDDRAFTIIDVSNFERLEYAYLTIELEESRIRTVVFYKYPSEQSSLMNNVSERCPIFRAQFKDRLLVIGNRESESRQ